MTLDLANYEAKEQTTVKLFWSMSDETQYPLQAHFHFGQH